MRIPIAAALVSIALLAPPRPARACGGCFSPPETVTSVDSHRMVVSLSPQRSMLWDQIRYTGEPEDFAWVLPVPTADPVVAVADELFFAELEAATAPVVFPPPIAPPSCPPLDCEPCAGIDGGSAGASDASGVDVYREEVVGPYESAVIGSEDPGALVAWLNQNGYGVPASAEPVIAHYVELGMKFVALRLAPDQGVSAMQPIRVEYPGYMATFPLQMVTIGAYGSLNMTLWVIAEQRYRPLNYADAVVPEEELIWDFAAGRSNYAELFLDVIDRAGGRAWITQMARPLGEFYFQSAEPELARADIPYPFLTRLATDMLVDHLGEDLELGPSDKAWLDSSLTAGDAINVPPPPACPTSCPCGPPVDGSDDRDEWIHVGCGCGASADAMGGLWLALALGGFLVFVRRRGISR